MKTRLNTRLLATLIISTAMLPAMAFAQDLSKSEIVQRAAVKAQIAQAEQDGTLHPSNVHYPDGVVPTSANAGNSGYGTASVGNSQSGSAANSAAVNALYRHQ
ncbi:DUF4148 domain-containing protein [Paraburkholderia sp. J67]|uniref:DUF4148 domain-containing protein n=1 Tax=Paraburkholderia sp. J67 TaxID=2805435 RepID=UPI002ABE838F|nr:DUF4148 domain-containing protein [Paraburkholderia sp. J67]